jgi:uncharacterized protein YqeY
MAAMKQKEVDERIELDDAAVITVIEKMLKQRKDSITQYEAAKRQDLADAEKFEVQVLSAYMPQALSSAELEAIIAKALVESGARAPAEMGKVIALVKPQSRRPRRHGRSFQAGQDQNSPGVAFSSPGRSTRALNTLWRS